MQRLSEVLAKGNEKPIKKLPGKANVKNRFGIKFQVTSNGTRCQAYWQIGYLRPIIDSEKKTWKSKKYLVTIKTEIGSLDSFTI